MSKLSEETGALGLACGTQGLTLAGVGLLRWKRGQFAPRPRDEVEQLLADAYTHASDVGAIIRGLHIVARGLNSGNLAHAMVGAVHLRLPDLDWQGAVRLAQSEDALAKYDPNEPRDWHGRWEDEGGTAWVKLPPGERIDELGDLLEWIVNARPEDEPVLRSEIKRLYYNVGDVAGGNALNQALSEAVYDGPLDARSRAELLDTYEHYTRADPAEIGAFSQALTGLALLPPLPLPSASPASRAWSLGWAARGRAIENALGANLSKTFPVIDAYKGGVVTSIKSIDLNAAVYRDATRLSARIDAYVDQLAEFRGASQKYFTLEESQIEARVLKLAVPKNSATWAQRGAISTSARRAGTLGVDLIVVPF